MRTHLHTVYGCLSAMGVFVREEKGETYNIYYLAFYRGSLPIPGLEVLILVCVITSSFKILPSNLSSSLRR